LHIRYDARQRLVSLPGLETSTPFRSKTLARLKLIVPRLKLVISRLEFFIAARIPFVSIVLKSGIAPLIRVVSAALKPRITATSRAVVAALESVAAARLKTIVARLIRSRSKRRSVAFVSAEIVSSIYRSRSVAGRWSSVFHFFLPLYFR
jgi:hypothetical protein